MYSIELKQESIMLLSSTHRAEIYRYGGLLNRFEINKIDGSWWNVVDAFSSPADARANLINGFHSAKLSPYACRMRLGEYEFSGKSYHCSKHTLGKHAIHGLMYDANFVLEQSHHDEHQAWVIIRADYMRDDVGYPFNYQLKIKYLLDESGLSITTEAINTGKTALPIMDGWHPYFTLGGKVDDWTLQINSTQQLEFNSDLLPTGKLLSDERFQAAYSLKNVQLDNSFVLKNHEVASCVLQNQALKFSIFAESSYPYLQVYIPPERDSIAIENLSAAPDSFNNKMGLVVLESGEIQVFSTRYVLQNQ